MTFLGVQGAKNTRKRPFCTRSISWHRFPNISIDLSTVAFTSGEETVYSRMVLKQLMITTDVLVEDGNLHISSVNVVNLVHSMKRIGSPNKNSTRTLKIKFNKFTKIRSFQYVVANLPLESNFELTHHQG